jgi:hypothetical protein
MIATSLKAVIGITVLLCGWLTVQLARRRVFAGHFPGGDAAEDIACGLRCGRCLCDPSAVQQENQNG